jgi:hypothetical protein
MWNNPISKQFLKGWGTVVLNVTQGYSHGTVLDRGHWSSGEKLKLKMQT